MSTRRVNGINWIDRVNNEGMLNGIIRVSLNRFNIVFLMSNLTMECRHLRFSYTDI